MGASRLIRIRDMGGTGWETGPNMPGQALNAPWLFSLICGGQFYIADRDNSRVVRIDDLAGNGWASYVGPPSDPFSRYFTTVGDV